ncbi:hypothetical protein WA538_004482 [Blastocystis sp. DL]
MNSQGDDSPNPPTQRKSPQPDSPWTTSLFPPFDPASPPISKPFVNIHPKVKKVDGSRQIPPTETSSRAVAQRKQRFHWDGALHTHFLQQLYKFGLETISTRKVFDTMRQYSNDITFDFIDNQLKSFREHLDESLREFSQYYAQAVHYQESYASDTVNGKFSIYPFAPQQSYLMDEAPHPATPPSAFPSISLPPIQDESLSRIAVPSFAAGADEEVPSLLREQVMDSQFQLHQDMISQNNYVLRKTELMPTASAVVGVNSSQNPMELFGITSSEDDSERVKRIRSERKRRYGEQSPMQLISSVLSAQNDRYVEQVDRILAEYPSPLRPDEVMQTDDFILPINGYDGPFGDDVFDFLH